MAELDIILISHGTLAEGLRQACVMITGEAEDVMALGMDEQVGAARFAEELTQLLAERSSGYVVLCDLFHGTPYNLCLGLAQEDLRSGRCKILCGASLPMLLEGVSALRTGAAVTPATLAEQMLVGARAGVVEAACPIPCETPDTDVPL